MTNNLIKKKEERALPKVRYTWTPWYVIPRQIGIPGLGTSLLNRLKKKLDQ